MAINRINAFGYNTEHNDQYELTSHAEYLVNGGLATVNGMRVGSDYSAQDSNKLNMLNRPTQYSIGVPRYFSYGKWNLGAQYTSLNVNPWIAFTGIWGSINNSGILENVVSYRDGGFSTQASLMNVTTNITPGLITKVNNITGVWAESGYRYTNMDNFGDFGLFAGIKPVVLSGDIEARMPTSVDGNGNITYTNKKLAIQNQVTPYLRALFSTKINKQTMYRFSAIATQQGQYRLMNEIRLTF
jgi:hypothetical protein